MPDHRIRLSDLKRFVPPNEKGGGGPDNPDMEARVARLEVHAEHILTVLTEIRSDIRNIKGEARTIKGQARTIFRVLFGAIIFVALGLMAHGFNWL